MRVSRSTCTTTWCVCVRARVGRFGVPAGHDQAHERIDGVRQRRRLRRHTVSVSVGVVAFQS